MSSFRIPTVVLAAALTITALYAQAPTAPEVNLPAGNVARGKAIFEGAKGNCTSCHRVNGAGSRFGPDLSAISAPPRGGGGGRGGGGAAPPAPAAPAPARGAATTPAAPARGGGFGGDEVANAAIGRGANAAPIPPVGGDAAIRTLAQSILDPNALVAVANRYVVLKMKDGKSITAKLLSVDTFNYQIFDSTEKLTNIPKDNVREMTMTSPMPSYKDKLSTQELADVVSYLVSLKGQ